MPQAEDWAPLAAELAGFDAVLGRHEVRLIEQGAQMRVVGGVARANAIGGFHGAFLAGIAEQSLGLPFLMRNGTPFSGMLTIDFSLQYFGQADVHQPVEVTVLITRETRRLAFVRGEIAQFDTPFVSFWSTLRKLS
jgi:acyl-coenzyme A thioesterase PaaI-like protein